MYATRSGLLETRVSDSLPLHARAELSAGRSYPTIRLGESWQCGASSLMLSRWTPTEATSLVSRSKPDSLSESEGCARHTVSAADEPGSVVSRARRTRNAAGSLAGLLSPPASPQRTPGRRRLCDSLAS